MDGIVVLHGEGVLPNTIIKGNIIDIGPTVLYSLGLPIPIIMDGQAIRSAFSPEYLAAHPIVRAAADQPASSGSTHVYSEEDEAQVMDRLRELGHMA